MIGELEFSYELCKCPVIAITGTNGKTTTTLLVEQMLNACGVRTLAAGNISPAFSSIVKQTPDLDVVTLEVSSFQLEKIRKFHPQVAVWLNLTPDHLDRYASVEEYRAAKLRMFENQTEKDFAIVNFRDNLPLAEGAADHIQRVCAGRGFRVSRRCGLFPRGARARHGRHKAARPAQRGECDGRSRRGRGRSGSVSRKWPPPLSRLRCRCRTRCELDPHAGRCSHISTTRRPPTSTRWRKRFSPRRGPSCSSRAARTRDSSSVPSPTLFCRKAHKCGADRPRWPRASSTMWSPRARPVHTGSRLARRGRSSLSRAERAARATSSSLFTRNVVLLDMFKNYEGPRRPVPLDRPIPVPSPAEIPMALFKKRKKLRGNRPGAPCTAAARDFRRAEHEAFQRR